MGIAFAPGTAILPADAKAALIGLAGSRAAHPILIVGYGEANSADAAAQQAALTLAVARANAIANALAAAGVPAADLQLDAEAAGRGGAARVIN